MATEEEELLAALGAQTIPQLPLSAELYEFAMTSSYPHGPPINPGGEWLPGATWHLVSMSGSFERVVSEEWPPGAPAAVKVVKYEPQVLALWARRKT
jgi:hypothetical protein